MPVAGRGVYNDFKSASGACHANKYRRSLSNICWDSYQCRKYINCTQIAQWCLSQTKCDMGDISLSNMSRYWAPYCKDKFSNLLRIWVHKSSPISFTITMTSWWARWRLKSPVSRLFTQTFIRAQIKKNIEAPRHWHLCGEFNGDRWIPRTKDQ